MTNFKKLVIFFIKYLVIKKIVINFVSKLKLISYKYEKDYFNYVNCDVTICDV